MKGWDSDYLRAAAQTARDARRLAPRLGRGASTHVVSIHDYAWPAFEAFVRRTYADGQPRVAAFSMNPARNGAVQTGLAFTDTPTARQVLSDFDRLVKRPRSFATDRVEMSGQKLLAWAHRDLGGLTGLYQRIVFPIALPLALLRGPRLLNVPAASLSGRQRALADGFYEDHAALLARAIQPTGLLLLGDYAARRWMAVVRSQPDLARLPSAVTHHPAARIGNEQKFNDWSRALSSLGAEPSSPISATVARP